MKILHGIIPIHNAELIVDIRTELKKEPVSFEYKNTNAIVFLDNKDRICIKSKGIKTSGITEDIYPEENNEYYGSIFNVTKTLFFFNDYFKFKVNYVVYGDRHNIHNKNFKQIKTFCLKYANIFSAEQQINLRNIDFDNNLILEIVSGDEMLAGKDNVYLTFSKKDEDSFAVEEIRKIGHNMDSLLTTIARTPIGYEKIFVSKDKEPKEYLLLDFNCYHPVTSREIINRKKCFCINNDEMLRFFTRPFEKLNKDLAPLYLWRAYTISESSGRYFLENNLEYLLKCIEQLYEIIRNSSSREDERRKIRNRFVEKIEKDENYKSQEELRIINWIKKSSERYFVEQRSYSSKMKHVFKKYQIMIPKSYDDISNKIRNSLSHRGLIGYEFLDTDIQDYYIWLIENTQNILLKILLG